MLSAFTPSNSTIAPANNLMLAAMSWSDIFGAKRAAAAEPASISKAMHATGAPMMKLTANAVLNAVNAWAGSRLDTFHVPMGKVRKLYHSARTKSLIAPEMTAPTISN